MRISSNKLASHLATKDGPDSAYLVLNDEPRMLSEDRDLIRKALGCDEKQLFLVDPSFDPKEAMAETESGSLFGGRTLLEFICVSPLGARDAERIGEIVSRAVGAGNAAIVASPAIAKRGKWVDKLEELFTVVVGTTVPFSRMPGWVKARAKSSGMDLDSEASEMIASMTEGNLSMAAQELEKLWIVHGEGETINLDMVRQGLSDQTRDDLHSLRESMASGDSLRSVRAIRNMRATKESPVLVLWAIAEEGKALVSMIDKKTVWGVFGEHKSRLASLARRLKRQDAVSFMNGVAKADLSAKGIGRSDIWIRCERLACAFTLMERHNRIDKRLLA